LQGWWRQIGIDTQPAAVDSDTLAEISVKYDFDILIWAWGSDPDPSFILSVPSSESIASGLNETGYANPEYDRLYKEQALVRDPVARRAIIWQMQRIMLDDVVYIIPFYPKTVQAYRTDKFSGWDIDSATLSLHDPVAIFKLKPIQK
jgi:peptide/nickel transport system substrate-binding protein